MDGAVGWATVRGVTRVQHNLQLDHYRHRVVYNIIQVYNIVIHNLKVYSHYKILAIFPVLYNPSL